MDPLERFHISTVRLLSTEKLPKPAFLRGENRLRATASKWLVRRRVSILVSESMNLPFA